MGKTEAIIDISGVKHWSDLSALMIDRVKPILGFDSFSILVIDGKREYYQKVAGVASGTIFFQDLPYKDTVIEHNVNLIEEGGEPILFLFDDNFTRFRDGNIINNLKNFGQKQAIVTTLKAGQQLVGIISLDSYRLNHFRREDFGVFQAIADQLAQGIKRVLGNLHGDGES